MKINSKLKSIKVLSLDHKNNENGPSGELYESKDLKPQRGKSKLSLKKIENPLEFKKRFFLTEKLAFQIEKDRNEIKNIISGKDDRKILIIGPCSVWPQNSVLDYAIKLKKVSEKVDSKIKIIMRVYSQKPRTMKG
jgi:phospho-2-dehydro-3-deoxyheptonate aldolase